MDALSESIEQHYHTKDLFISILQRLAELQIDTNAVTRADISGVDEFHVRGAEVSEELADTIPLEGARVLDVGCGLGGPSRMLAGDYGCDVTGIDLSTEFIRTAKKLSELLHLDHKTTFIHGNATELPFEDQSFDVVWTQHVQMNINDKDAFYSEIVRVLKPGGYFLYYDIFRKGRGEMEFPLPWATNPEMSFLSPPTVMDLLLKGQGLLPVSMTDQTEAGVRFFEAFLPTLGSGGRQKPGLGMLMGPSAKTKIQNLLGGLNSGNIILQSGAYLKENPGQMTN
jgi:SAM-dependent methyltransferase